MLLLIEVADTSLADDRTSQAPPLSAEAGVSDYWIVDCTTETVEVYPNPGPDGYRDVTRAASTATLTLQSFPDV